MLFSPHTQQIQGSCMQDPAKQLIEWFREGPYAIAFSGGVDSAVVAQAAYLSGRPCYAITASSESVAQKELNDAARVALQIGIEHRHVSTAEGTDPDYIRNDARRCFHCKTHLFSAIRKLDPTATILTGTNADDLNDYRPGLVAADQAQVRAPLAELGFDKSLVRKLAALWSLPIANKPASPCLASRVAYGLEVTPQRLSMVERAEAVLRSHGFEECRVRVHPGELARIEVPATDIRRLTDPQSSAAIQSELSEIGFQFVAVDLQGFQSGNLNRLVNISIGSQHND